MKNRSFTLSILVTLALLALTATAVLAAPPLDLHIEALEYIATSGEPFAASGGAVDAGLVCPSGTVDDLDVAVIGRSAADLRLLRVLKQFSCDDLSGTFDIELMVKLDLLTGETTATWKIAGGTGSYTDLKGTGSLTGTPVSPGASILDVYDGIAH